MYVGLIHVYGGTDLRTQLGFQKPMKDKFSTLMLRFGMNFTSSGSLSKPLFSHYIKPYMAPFQNTQKILRENLRFTRNSESNREFFTKHPQVNFILIRTFSGLDPQVLKFTNHFGLVWIDLAERNGQNQAKRAFILRYIFQTLFFHFYL